MTARDLGPCVLCGRHAQEAHHFTASLAGSDVHLDPAATISLCRACHKAEHAAWRAVGLDRFSDPVLARVCRLTWTIGRLAGSTSAVPPPLGAFHGVLVSIRDAVTDLVTKDAP